MAMDSIIARPTNKVRVMVAEASGCWASEVSAVATALPSASAGPDGPQTDGDAGDDNRCHRDNSHAIHSFSFCCRSSCSMFGTGSGLGLRTRVAAAMYTAARMLKM